MSKITFVSGFFNMLFLFTLINNNREKTEFLTKIASLEAEVNLLERSSRNTVFSVIPTTSSLDYLVVSLEGLSIVVGIITLIIVFSNIGGDGGSTAAVLNDAIFNSTKETVNTLTTQAVTTQSTVIDSITLLNSKIDVLCLGIINNQKSILNSVDSLNPSSTANQMATTALTILSDPKTKSVIDTLADTFLN